MHVGTCKIYRRIESSTESFMSGLPTYFKVLTSGDRPINESSGKRMYIHSTSAVTYLPTYLLVDKQL